jgi:hypothetical protein
VPCTSCLVAGEVCLPNGQLGTVPNLNPNNLPPGDTEPYTVVMINSSTGAVPPQADQVVCAPPPAPPPPTAGDVLDTAPLPSPEVGFDPGTDGIVQLPTWFWLKNDPAGVNFTVGPISVGGYSVVLTVHPVAYYWSFGDGQTATSHTAGGPGSAAAASTVHTYLEKGTYVVGVSVAWQGSYTFSGYGFSQTVPLGPVDQTPSVHDYIVQEVRSVLTHEGPG